MATGHDQGFGITALLTTALRPVRRCVVRAWLRIVAHHYEISAAIEEEKSMASLYESRKYVKKAINARLRIADLQGGQ